MKKLVINVITDEAAIFDDTEIENLIKTKQDFIDGKTTARDWKDIEEDLNRVYKLNY